MLPIVRVLDAEQPRAPVRVMRELGVRDCKDRIPSLLGLLPPRFLKIYAGALIAPRIRDNEVWGGHFVNVS